MISTGRFTHQLRKLTHYSFDHCSHCGKELIKNVPALAGYTNDDLEIYVGECCRSQISELASHIYWWWESYKRPTPNTFLWRYMDFSKFVALLNSRAIFFSKAKLLGDPFEGARGFAHRQAEWKQYCLEYYRNAIKTIPGQTEPPTEEYLKQESERLYYQVEASGEREVENTFVSCWHANVVESEALWRLYAPPATNGVAICTEFQALDDALDSNFDIKFGYIQYINFEKRFAGTYDRIFWKRASLSHESEVRGVIYSGRNEPIASDGLLVPFDISTGIKTVVTSPFAPIWFNDVVKATTEQFGFELPVRSSELLLRPFF